MSNLRFYYESIPSWWHHVMYESRDYWAWKWTHQWITEQQSARILYPLSNSLWLHVSHAQSIGQFCGNKSKKLCLGTAEDWNDKVQSRYKLACVEENRTFLLPCCDVKFSRGKEALWCRKKALKNSFVMVAEVHSETAVSEGLTVRVKMWKHLKDFAKLRDSCLTKIFMLITVVTAAANNTERFHTRKRRCRESIQEICVRFTDSSQQQRRTVNVLQSSGVKY